MSGRDNNRRRPPRKEKHNQERRSQNNQHTSAKVDSWKRNGRDSTPVKYDKNGIPYERPHWTAPKLNTEPLPVPNCSRCGQPITDLHTAFTDNRTEGQVHFDCVMAELSKREALEEDNTLSYIGGGRFGVVRFANSTDKGKQKTLLVEKIVEWEDKEKRADWRGVIADHYSIT